MSSQIVTIGGGGFLTGTEPCLDSYVLDQTTSETPKIGFIGTASGDDLRFIVRFFSRFSKMGCTPSALGLFGRVQNIEEWILEQDIIYVGGGNTKSMLGVWSNWGIPQLLEAALSNGTILSGVSAGAICWFDAGVTDSLGSSLTALDGLGFIEGSCCPHYSVEVERKPMFEEMILRNELAGGVAIDDGAAIHWMDGKPIKVIIGKAGASAYSVSSINGSIVSKPIEGADYVDIASE